MGVKVWTEQRMTARRCRDRTIGPTSETGSATALTVHAMATRVRTSSYRASRRQKKKAALARTALVRSYFGRTEMHHLGIRYISLLPAGRGRFFPVAPGIQINGHLASE